MKRNDIQIEDFKKKLEGELVTIEGELRSVGRINPDNALDWEATPPVMDTIPADRSENADQIEEFEANTAILKELEIRFNNIKDALKAIEDGSYGICKTCGELIDVERLEAMPSATTCIVHA
jgi:RNA polymerase-binding transcription factor DksA